MRIRAVKQYQNNFVEPKFQNIVSPYLGNLSMHNTSQVF